MASRFPCSTGKTPKVSNLSSRNVANRGNVKSIPYQALDSDKEKLSKFAPPLEETAPKDTRYLDDEFIDDLQQLEKCLEKRFQFEMDVSDQLSSLAEDHIDVVQSSSPFFSPSTLELFSRAPSANRDTVVEDLQRDLKIANQESSAKTDAFDLIYGQWHALQTELDQTKKEMAAKLKEKDDAISALQFKLFWAESEIDEYNQRLSNDSVIEVMSKEENFEDCQSMDALLPFRDTRVSGTNKTEIDLQLRRVQLDDNGTTPLLPRKLHSDDIVGADDKPLKKAGIFSSLSKQAKKGNRTRQEKRRNVFSRKRSAILK